MHQLASRIVALVAAISFVSTSQAATVTLTVTTLADNFTAPIAGSLRAAINTANADPTNSYVINFNVAGGGTLALNANAAGARMLPILTNPSGISINGANGGQGAIIIDGGSTNSSTGDRIFFIGVAAGTPAAAGGNLPSTASTSFAISNLTLRNANARGGSGTTAAKGGGGAGLGGAIFVDAGALSLSGVTFTGNRATGGNGGSGPGGSVGGGGGMGGNGGGAGVSGGGGFGIGANGGAASAASGAPGGAGQFTAAKSGGSSTAGSVGGSAGGGGAGSLNFSEHSAGGGGVGAANGSGSSGGSGGFGGGGGAGGGAAAGNGGFGGGGGGAPSGTASGGIGGFGGGGGGGGAGGAGGFGAGAGTAGGSGKGGNGAGLGGAIFVRRGASVTLLDGGISGGTAAAGTLGNGGQGIGSGLFLAGSANYAVSTGATVTIADTLGGGMDSQITGGFTKSGDGELILSGANTYTGGTTVSAGALLVNNTTGSGTGVGHVIVTGGMLGGTGRIAGTVIVNAGTLSPGASIESLDIGSLGMTSSSSIFLAELDLGSSLAADLLNVTGSVSLNKARLDLQILGVPVEQTAPLTFLLVENDGSDLVNLNSGAGFGTITGPAGYDLSINYAFTGADALGRIGDGNDIAITLTAAVPEPGSLFLLAAGAGTMLLRWPATRRARRIRHTSHASKGA